MGNLRDKYSEEEWDELNDVLFNDDANALILSPKASMDENVKLFNNWVKAIYKNELS